MFRPPRILQSRLCMTTNQLAPGIQFRVALRHSSSVADASTTTTLGSTRTSGQSSKWPRRLIYATIFGSLGLYAGSWTERHLATPPIPGSEADATETRLIQRAYEMLPVVKDLRENPEYEESDVYENLSEEKKRHRLTSGPMSGSRGLGLQRIFWKDHDQSAIGIVYFGSGLEGWPTMVHGGALGTVIDEHLGRVALRSFPAETGVTANLDINYRRPVYSSNFYTFHTTLDRERSTDRKAFVKNEVRDLTGRVCVEATGIFVVPKQLQLQKLGGRF